MKTKTGPPPLIMNFEAMEQSDVPNGRNGKHKEFITKILQDLAQLEEGQALKIPMEALPFSKDKTRSALNRATRKLGIEVATSSDSDHLYVWKTA